VALETMGFKTFGIGGGREDVWLIFPHLNRVFCGSDQ